MNDNTDVNSPANLGIAEMPPPDHAPPGYREVIIKAVIAYDDKDWLIHGSSDETVPNMAKAIVPLWNHDPSKEAIQCVEIKLLLPLVSEMKTPVQWG